MEQRQRSLTQAGTEWSNGIREDYQVIRGFVVGIGDNKGLYYPMADDRLALDFANTLKDDRLLAFVRDHGMVGTWSLREPRRNVGVDRLTELQEQANKVGRLLTLFQDAPASFEHDSLAFAHALGELHEALGAIRPGIGLEFGEAPDSRAAILQKKKEMPRYQAPLRRLALRWQFGTLLDAIYWNLARYVTGQLQARQCGYCGRYFEVTDQRQWFCPPPAGSWTDGSVTRRQSACGWRFREATRKVKKGETNG